MRIICQQTILMKYHALFVAFLKSRKIWNCRLLQILGGALWIKLILSKIRTKNQYVTRPLPMLSKPETHYLQQFSKNISNYLYF